MLVLFWRDERKQGVDNTICRSRLSISCPLVGFMAVDNIGYTQPGNIKPHIIRSRHTRNHIYHHSFVNYWTCYLLGNNPLSANWRYHNRIRFISDYTANLLLHLLLATENEHRLHTSLFPFILAGDSMWRSYSLWNKISYC